MGTVQSSPKIYGGTLMVRVGNRGEFVRAGSSVSFTADADGPLQLGIAMPSAYTRYDYTGGYEVKIRISGRQ